MTSSATGDHEVPSLPTRNWAHIERCLELLRGQVYDEPITKSHALITADSFRRLVLPARNRIGLALDVGCGQGVALRHFKNNAIPAIGICLSSTDARICRENGFDVSVMDQSFLSFRNEHFDLLWSRHCLEHSPMPLLTLFEYARVLRTGGNLYVEVPQPDTIHFGNQNHYSLFSDRGWRNLFKRAGFRLLAAHVYPVPFQWRNSKAPGGVLALEDYYYAYWLAKVESAGRTDGTPQADE